MKEEKRQWFNSCGEEFDGVVNCDPRRDIPGNVLLLKSNAQQDELTEPQ